MLTALAMMDYWLGGCLAANVRGMLAGCVQNNVYATLVGTSTTQL